MTVAESTSGLHTRQSGDFTHTLASYGVNHSSILFIPCDNPRNVVSPFLAEMVDLVVYAGIFPVLVICGVIANVINMAVFVRQGLSNRIHLCLFSVPEEALALVIPLATYLATYLLIETVGRGETATKTVSDTGFLLFLMCGKSYALISLVDPVAGNYWQQRHNGPVLGNYLGFLSISNTITALIAVERCLCILSPLKAAKFFKTRYMKVVITVVAVYILTVMNVSLGLKYQTVQITDPITNTSTFISRLTPIYLRHSTLIEVLYTQMLCVILPTISLIVVTICTIAIILRLKVTATWRRRTISNMTSVEKQEVSVTRMLVTVCCVYLVCMIPNVTKSLVLFTRIPGFLVTGHLCNAFKMTIALTHVLEAFNCSVNFLIYIKQSSRYRATLSQLCCWVTTQQQEKKTVCEKTL